VHPRRRFSLSLPDGRTLALGERTLIMGIINVTPDSFSDGGQLLNPQRAVDAGVQMVADGADLLDVGGESTRPGAEPLAQDEERRRVVPVIDGLSARVKVPISPSTLAPRWSMTSAACATNPISPPSSPDVVLRSS